MKTKLRRLSARVVMWLGSRYAWYAVLGLFLLEAIWFVLSAQYPMAFDENYHLGLIRLHAAQWLPFFTAQPQNAAVYGEVVRDPSYLYHWLMSFPYRLISALTANLTAQIIFLRILNVAMFAGALLLYRRILQRIHVSDALSTSLFAVFVMIPSVPFLAAHINYDNLFMLAIPLSVLLTMRLMDGIRQRTIDAGTLLLLLGTLFLSSLIKYPFLPVFAVIVLFLIVYGWHQRVLSRAGWMSLVDSFRALSRLRRALLILLLLVSFGLFAERYAANIITYHDPVPACDAVISQDECVQYGPYGRDHLYAQQKPASFHPNIFVYVGEWFYGMWYRLFFAINYDYATAPPLIVISRLAIGVAALLAIGIILRFRALFAGKPMRQLLLWLVIGYALVLFEDGFSSYAKTAQPVAINGRYLIPFLPFAFAFGGLAWSQLLRKHPSYKTAFAGLVIGLFLLQGGGAMTFIIRSGDTWMWNNTVVRSVNRAVRSAAWPFIIGKGVS
jgi:hypothetical protein